MLEEQTRKDTVGEEEEHGQGSLEPSRHLLMPQKMRWTAREQVGDAGGAGVAGRGKARK